MGRRVLIIDDEASIRTSLSGALEDEAYEIATAGDGEEGLHLIKNQSFDAVLLDVWMPGIDGIETLRRIKNIKPKQLVVIMSGHGTIETAVSATKEGAFDFIEKPLSLEKLLITLRNGLALNELNEENQLLRTQILSVSHMVGSSERIKELSEQIETVAPMNSWVLITGENGTGKELVAKTVHNKSKRARKPFIAVNCAAIPENLIESELFGHEKGSFTGATEMRRGKFDQANGGTLFLDEIGDMSLPTQAKVLRILQEQKFERVGGNQTIQVDVRVIAATNKDLVSEIKENRFREDLYYRLNVIPLKVPPLRERAEDIHDITKFYLDYFATELGREPKQISQKAVQALQAYSWPGNVRELKNTIERLSIMVKGEVIKLDDLPTEILDEVGDSVSESSGLIRVMPDGDVSLKAAKNEFEKDFILKKLEENDWNISKTAQCLGIERTNLHRKIKSYNILEKESENG